MFSHRNCIVTQKRPENVNRNSHAVNQKVSFSMTLSDLNLDFEVTAFFEVEYLGPDWSRCEICDQVFDF